MAATSSARGPGPLRRRARARAPSARPDAEPPFRELVGAGRDAPRRRATVRSSSASVLSGAPGLRRRQKSGARAALRAAALCARRRPASERHDREEGPNEPRRAAGPANGPNRPTVVIVERGVGAHTFAERRGPVIDEIGAREAVLAHHEHRRFAAAHRAYRSRPASARGPSPRGRARCPRGSAGPRRTRRDRRASRCRSSSPPGAGMGSRRGLRVGRRDFPKNCWFG